MGYFRSVVPPFREWVYSSGDNPAPGTQVVPDLYEPRLTRYSSYEGGTWGHWPKKLHEHFSSELVELSLATLFLVFGLQAKSESLLLI